MMTWQCENIGHTPNLLQIQVTPKLIKFKISTLLQHFIKFLYKIYNFQTLEWHFLGATSSIAKNFNIKNMSIISERKKTWLRPWNEENVLW
jgi:hypothetical protein